MAGDAKGTRNRTSGRTSAQHHHDGRTLCDATRLWMTPDTPGGGRSMPSGTSITGRTPDGRKVTVGLANQARLWMTPTARDHKDGATSLANTPVNGLLGRQVLTMPPGGDDTSSTRRSLNPLFVEALMGWPTGWTGFGSVATVWCHWLRRMRCELSRLSYRPIDGNGVQA
jgi:hypothetical protein